jgi:hypothetical protein
MHLFSLNNPDECLPLKTKRKTNISKPPALKSSFCGTPKFNLPKTHIHCHKSIIVIAAVTISSEDPVGSFVGNIHSLMKDIRIIDPMACFIGLFDKDKRITNPALVLLNQTMLRGFIMISIYVDKNPFNKQKTNNNNNNTKKKSENKWNDPTVYFQFALASDVEPATIIGHVRLEWFQIGGAQLQVKELQSLNIDVTHLIYNVLTQGNNTEVLVEELQAMLNKACFIALEEQSDKSNCAAPIPPFTLRTNFPKIDGQNIFKLKEFPYEVQKTEEPGPWNVKQVLQDTSKSSLA